MKEKERFFQCIIISKKVRSKRKIKNKIHLLYQDSVSFLNHANEFSKFPLSQEVKNRGVVPIKLVIFKFEKIFF